MQTASITLTITTLVCLTGVSSYMEEGPEVTHKVRYGLISKLERKKNLERVVIGLFGKIVPKTVHNFLELSKRPRGQGYKGNVFHRVVKNFMIQAGDFTKRDGSGGRSIYGDTFPDENFELKHYGAGWVSMANTGEDTNNSQFFITLDKTDWLDGHHVVFGKVLSGMDAIRKIEATDMGRNFDLPRERVLIVDCGTEIVAEPFKVSRDDAIDIE